MTDRRADRPQIAHRLSVVFRFRDAFSGAEITAPLDVSAAALPFAPGVLPPPAPWPAVPESGTYRFKTTNHQAAPIGPVDFAVSDASGTYASFEAISVTLPRPVSSPPLATDFLVERSLWPTRKFRPRAPETNLVVVVRSAGATNVAGLRVFVWKHTGAPPPATPYTYTDAAGEALCRLLGADFKITPTGGATAAIDVELRRPPLFTTAVPILSPGLPLPVDLGATTVLFVNVP